MSKSTLLRMGGFLLSTALAMPAAAGAPNRAPAGLPHYVLFDVGTFGGASSNFFGVGGRQLNRHGEAVGADNTSLPDPLAPDLCFDNCLIDHGFKWKNGGTNELGALFGSSVAIGINDEGLTVGLSQNGKFDHATGLFQLRAVVWKDGRVKNLGTLGGTQSSAGPGANNLGQVAVQSSNADPNDPYIGISQANCIWLPTTGRGCSGPDFGINVLFLPVATQTHGAVWSKEAGLVDTGTLGGPDSAVFDINDSGQAVGWSYTSYTAGASGVPDTRPFLWDNGTPTDLGSLGGTFGEATLINKNGQVTGTSNLAGDTEVRPFIWDKVNGMRDLGGLGGNYGHGDWINDRGDVVGFSRTTPGSIAGHAFYWHSGSMADLGTIGGDAESEATAINNRGVIVGGDFYRDENGNGIDLRGWVSAKGSPPVDLNTLIRKPHGLYITAATQINDRGAITANAVTRSGATHAVVLVPETALDMLARMKASTPSHRQDFAAPPTRSEILQLPRPGCGGAYRTRITRCRRG